MSELDDLRAELAAGALAEAERRGRIAELTETIDGIVGDLATARQDSAHSAVLALEGLREVLTARLAELDPQAKDAG